MGIKGLFPFLSGAAPSSIKPRTPKDFTSRTLAIDASTCLYQFIIAVRSESDGFASLTNDKGEITSHLNGFLMRTLKLLEAGVKPIYVFDGDAPVLKASELRARRDRRDAAQIAELEARVVDGVADERVREASDAAARAVERLQRLAPAAAAPGVAPVPSEADALAAAAAAAAAIAAAAAADAAARAAAAETARAAAADPAAEPAEAEARAAQAAAAAVKAQEAQALAAAAAASEAAAARLAADAAAALATARVDAAAARSALDEASAAAAGSKREVEKAARRSARVTRQHALDAIKLLRLMGVPVVEAPGEAEATCAALCAAGHAYAVASEDMDALTFGAPRMLKNLFDTETHRVGGVGGTGKGEGGKRPVYEICLQTVLEQLGLSAREFVDFCMLCGCDFLPHLPKVGAVTAIKLMLAQPVAPHAAGDAAAGGAAAGGAAAVNAPGADGVSPRCIEALLAAKALPPSAHALASSAEWPFDAAREVFLKPAVARPSGAQLAPSEPDYAALHAFLVERHSFAPARVEAALKRLRAVRAAKTQTRLDQFFAPQHKAADKPAPQYDPLAKKRKAAGTPTAPAARKRSAPAHGARKGAGGGKT
ncbi:hypothetical protein KFE25_005364 [Diacronema lutheri]|uniref:Flap endonuclease 1 n=1 Tax=Diacronema lutheri TaxID=2081491 RepID=A0A8J5XM30_DIALT|nr:hypothetical protein KFE25_005364 [Diacronema lutheri]